MIAARIERERRAVAELQVGERIQVDQNTEDAVWLNGWPAVIR